MNERIKQIWEDSEEIEFRYPEKGRLTSASEQTLKKFAELIVRECAEIADLADENKCEWIGGNILTHFGVE